MDGRRAKQLLSFTVFNLIVAFFPLTTLVVNNSHILWQPRTPELAALVGFFLAIFLVNQVVYLIFGRTRIQVLFYLSMFLLFLWNPFLTLIDNRGILGAAIYFVLIAALFLAALRASRSERFTTILASMLFVFSVLPAVQLGVLAVAGESPPSDNGIGSRGEGAKPVQADLLPYPKLRPNIYLLIFDTMTSTGQFLDRIDGSERSAKLIDDFQRSMSSLRYVHLANSWSNHGRTSPSMFSLFDFGYDFSSRFRWNQQYFGFRGSALLQYLKRAGYTIIAKKLYVRAGYPGVGSACPGEFDFCYESANQLELVSMLAAATPALYVIQRLEKYAFTPLESNLIRKPVARLTSMKLQEVQQFIEYIDGKTISGNSEFTYSHFFASHPGNYYDENCETASIALFEQRSGEGRASSFDLDGYGKEYLCFLKQIEAVAEAINRRDPEAWVFIFSDHGYGAQSYGIDSKAPWDRERLDATFRILNLARTSPACAAELAAVKSTVNKARAIINCMSEETVLPYLPEQVDLRYVNENKRLTIHGDRYE